MTTDLITLRDPLEMCDKGGCLEVDTEILPVGQLILRFCPRHMPEIDVLREAGILYPEPAHTGGTDSE